KRCTKRLNAGAAGGQARRGQVRRARRQARWVRPGPLQAPRAVPPWASARKPRSAAGAGVDLCLLLAAELERRVQGPDALVQLLLADQRRDADLRGGDQLDVDPGLGQRLAERG